MMQESHFEGSKSSMNTRILKIRHHIDSLTKYLAPLLPIANCHMVEFLTQNHWDGLLPDSLRDTLNGLQLNEALEQFWTAASDKEADNSILSNWIHTARSHCVSVNNDYCLSAEQLRERIRSWGGEIKPEIRVKEFMTSKKSYEVQTMSPLVAALQGAAGARVCVEAGGGRGPLALALCLAYCARCLTLDCDARAVAAAPHRIKIIQQWHAIAKRIKNGIEERIDESIDKNLHRFATAYITEHTDIASFVRDKFPEFADQDVKFLLTGLHTCGNLGPDSLRIFVNQSSTAAVFNVPCCYHLLTEAVDGQLFDVFQRDYGGEDTRQGFPMSEYLRGYNLGRNARMLAAQSIDRVVNDRQLPSTSLLYRALLQDIIQKQLPNHKISEGKLKRITPKCQTFQQYFKMADEILKLELYDSLPASFFTDVERSMDYQWKNLVLFYLIRLCLAQVVESLILLDRLLFLFENGFDNVYLVKLFDPVLSPRCHSIVAVR
ncbi:methyltransferase-like protein 25 isoform X2 [Spodoptera litura]|uniref:Methyltransferase-like protein 25 isoform X2 n=1 Tax=Spodoptera litura TaxID=69820 RepID=A0A9J7EEA2_SPOLT|nr:methyltransferase-like protein 25 isoform X2 [Spodoptera litura]